MSRPARFGYTRWAMIDLVRQHRAGKLELFAPPGKPGPPPGVAPAKDRARGRVIELRWQGLSAYEISRRRSPRAPRSTGRPWGRSWPRRGSAAAAPPRAGGQHQPCDGGPGHEPARGESPGLRYVAGAAGDHEGGAAAGRPDLVSLDLPALVSAAGYPGTWVIPGISWLLSLLALKLTRLPWPVSHAGDLLADPAAGLLAGMAASPKKTVLTDYSYRLSHDHQQRFLAALDKKMIAGGLASADEAVFDLDFHAVMHWGRDPAPGKALRPHALPARPVRADLLRPGHRHAQPRLRQRRPVQGHPGAGGHRVLRPLEAGERRRPKTLIMDEKVTTQDVLGEVDQRRVKFATLRMPSARS